MEERLLQLLRFVPETHGGRFCLFQSPVAVKDQKYLFSSCTCLLKCLREREREREPGRRVILIIKKKKEVIIEGTKTKVWGCWCVTSGKWKRTDNKNGNDGFDFRAYPHFSVLFLFLGATAVWEGCDHINDTGVHSFTLITVFQNGFSFYKYLLSRSSYIGILYNLVHFYNLFLLSFSFFFYQLLYMCVYIY